MSLAVPAQRAQQSGPPSPASTCEAQSPGPRAQSPELNNAAVGSDVPVDQAGSLPSTWSEADGIRPIHGPELDDGGDGGGGGGGEALRMACQLRRLGSSSTLSGETTDGDTVSSHGSWQPLSTLRSYLTPATATNPAFSRPTSAWTARSERMFTPFTCRSSRSPSTVSDNPGPLGDTRWCTAMYAHNLSAGGWRHLGNAPNIVGQPTGWQKMKAWVSASPALVFFLLPFTLKSKITTRLHKKLCKDRGILWEKDRKICRCGNQMAWVSDYGRTHCRSCGVCVCHACVTKQHLPELGFHEPVSICHECSISRIALLQNDELQDPSIAPAGAEQASGQLQAEKVAMSETRHK